MVRRSSWWCDREWHVKWYVIWPHNMKHYVELVLCRLTGYDKFPIDQRLFDLYIKDSEDGNLYPIGTMSYSDLKNMRDALSKLLSVVRKDELKPTDSFVKEI